MVVDIQGSFEYFISQKRYAQALVLAYRYEELQQLPAFMELQNEFVKRLQLAALYVKKGQKEKAYEILGEFRRIEEKKIIIELLFSSQEQFFDFLRFASDGAVMQAYAIANTDKRFQKLSLYTTVIEKIEHTLKRIEDSINNCEFVSDEILLSMQEYPRAKELLEVSKMARELYEAFEKEQLCRCYVLIDTHLALQKNLLAQQLQNHWQKIVKKAQYYMELGLFESVIRTFGDLLHVETRKKQVGVILRKTFRQKIYKQIEQKAYNQAEKDIYFYLETFGEDILFHDVVKLFVQRSNIQLAIVESIAKDEYQWMQKL
jgi:chaperonin cofactor prefoldin